MSTNVFLTGVSGFIGGHLVKELVSLPEFNLKASVRTVNHSDELNTVFVPAVDEGTAWSKVLLGQQVVIHLAARAHVMNENVEDALAEYRRVNVRGTLNLARQAAAHGARRFIFISSIKVNGEETPVGKPFSELDPPNPEGATGIAKWEAERGLHEISAETGMEIVIIRPSLVYGQGVKGNFANLVTLVSKGVLLPLGAIKNQRSLVSVDNLVSLIICCINHPAAANQVFLASDGVDLSTTQLLRCVAKARSVPSRLISVPSSLLMFTATIFGKKSVAQRLLGSLQVDISKARELLGWTPPLSVEEGLRRCFQPEIK